MFCMKNKETYKQAILKDLSKVSKENQKKAMLIWINQKVDSLNNCEVYQYDIDSLQCYLDIYNKLFSVIEVKGKTNTGEEYNWKEKAFLILVHDEIGKVYFIETKQITSTAPKLNNKINLRFAVTKKGDLQLFENDLWDRNKIVSTL